MKFELDRETARALVESRYMPLARYVELFGAESDEQPVGRSGLVRIELPPASGAARPATQVAG